MRAKVLSFQIPTVWEQIKYAVVATDNVASEKSDQYLNSLLCDLLADKAHCFIRYGEDNLLQAIAIARIVYDDPTGETHLLIQSMYSFGKVDTQTWKEDVDYLTLFAKNRGCTKLLAYSANQRIFSILLNNGFVEDRRFFIKSLEG